MHVLDALDDLSHDDARRGETGPLRLEDVEETARGGHHDDVPAEMHVLRQLSAQPTEARIAWVNLLLVKGRPHDESLVELVLGARILIARPLRVDCEKPLETKLSNIEISQNRPYLMATSFLVSRSYAITITAVAERYLGLPAGKRNRPRKTP